MDLSKNPTKIDFKSINDDPYIIVSITDGDACESNYFFIKYKGNETQLKNLFNEIDKVKEPGFDEDWSIIDIDLEHFVSSQTAKQMCKIDINPESFHRKFDGIMKPLPLHLKKSWSDKKKLKKIHRLLGEGKFAEYLTEEDIDESDFDSDDTIEDEDREYYSSEDSSTEDEKKQDLPNIKNKVKKSN